jgi:hypothetical protein
MPINNYWYLVMLRITTQEIPSWLLILLAGSYGDDDIWGA